VNAPPTHVKLFAYGTSTEGHNAELRGMPRLYPPGFGSMQEDRLRQMFEWVRPSLSQLQYPAFGLVPLREAPEPLWGLCRLDLQGQGSLGWVATLWTAVFSTAELDALDWAIDRLLNASFWPPANVSALPSGQRWPDAELGLAPAFDSASVQARIMDHLLPWPLPEGRLVIDVGNADEKSLACALFARMPPAARRERSFSTLPLMASDVRLLLHASNHGVAVRDGDVRRNAAEFFERRGPLPLLDEFRRAAEHVAFPDRSPAVDDDIEKDLAGISATVDFEKFREWRGRLAPQASYKHVLVRLLPYVFDHQLRGGAEPARLLQTAKSEADALEAMVATEIAKKLAKNGKLAAASGDMVRWLTASSGWLKGHTQQLAVENTDFAAWWPHVQKAAPEPDVLAAFAMGLGTESEASAALTAFSETSKTWLNELGKRPSKPKYQPMWQLARARLDEMPEIQVKGCNFQNLAGFYLHRSTLGEV
jgi:hypothetical protein